MVKIPPVTEAFGRGQRRPQKKKAKQEEQSEEQFNQGKPDSETFNSSSAQEAKKRLKEIIPDLPANSQFIFDPKTQMIHLTVGPKNQVIRRFSPEEIDEILENYDEKKGLIVDQMA